MGPVVCVECYSEEGDTVPREPGCQCHWEVGDSPCRVHVEDEEPETAEAGPSGEPTKQTKFVPPSSGYPVGSLADEVMRIVFAFNHGDSRRDDVRELASRVSNLEAARAALTDWQHWGFELLPMLSPGEGVTDDSVLRDRIGAAVRNAQRAEPAAQGVERGRLEHLEQGAKLLLALEEHWREMEDGSGMFYEAFSNWCHAERDER